MHKKTYGAKDFTIDETTILTAKPVKLLHGGWGVFLSHEQVAELRNHLIVSVETQAGKSWLARLERRDHADKKGVSFSTEAHRIDLATEAELGFLLYRQRLADLARGKLFRSSDVVLPNQNEKLVQDSSKGRRSTRPRQRYLTRSR